MSIAGIVLAAGRGERFGERPKLLASLAGTPLLTHAIAAQCQVAALERIIVVLGAHAEQILAGVEFGRAEPIVCDRWADGQSASLRCGARVLRGVDRVIVTLGDMPLVGAALIDAVAAADPPARAAHDGRPGHPVLLGPEQLALLRTLHGDTGARGLLAGATLLECRDQAAISDVDTPADLQRLRRVVMQAAAGQVR